ncbi:MAG: hypothetical protein PWP10_3069 [Clostridiales bacterium]|jgi:sugar phosphate isomerase/epimerase|nr:hypothetical protein [Clostridiales bacterium]
MKLGLVSAILDKSSFEEVIDLASDIGYECVELACWPRGKAERRYAGVTHLDVVNTSLDEAKQKLIYAKNRNVEISSLAYYPNTLDPDLEVRALHINHLMKLIDMSSDLGVGMVTTFVGRDQNKTIEQNLEIFYEVWKPIVEYALDKNVKIAIENCPMLFTADQWPGGQNLATTPAIWRRMFELIPYGNFGLNYDPSHFVWQHIDYIKPIYEFKDRIFHVHFKDIKIYIDKLNDHGVMAYPLEYMSPKLPGLGDVNWGKYVSALSDINYDGYACIEIEDKAFEGNDELVKKSILLSYNYIRQFVI